MDKLKELSLGEKIVAAAGILLLIFSFFSWYSVDLGGFGTYSRNGWQSPGSFWGIIAILLGIVMAAQVIVDKLGLAQLPDKLGSVGWGTIHLIGGVVAFVFVIIKFLNESSHTSFGFYLGIIAAAGLAFGGFTIAKERGELPGALNKGGGSSSGPTPPAPPSV
ncbi:MAG: hypothetical protein U0V73_04050 [Acidimicrobiia bacterium]